MTVSQPKERFLKQFEQLDRVGAAVKFQPLRQSARSRFRELPLPTSRTEDWRFTSIAPLVGESFELSGAVQADAAVLPVATAADALRLVFINGRFVGGLSHLRGAPAGVALGPLANAPDTVTRSLGRVADFQDHAIPLALILQMVRGAVGGEAGDHAGAKVGLALVGEQRRLAFEHVNELVLPRMPMMQRGCGARRQPR